MLTIYHGKHTRSLRVVWTAEELGLHYAIKHTPFDPAALRTPEFLTISPHGQLPAIEDGGTRMVESGAICQYLTERYGKHPFKRSLGDADALSAMAARGGSHAHSAADSACPAHHVANR
jgi:glutathione S-transferase